MNVICKFAYFIAAITLSGCAQGGAVDYGGNILKRQLIVATKRVELPPVCYSACTMHMANGCVRPEIELGFHKATHPSGTRTMSRYYPPEIRDWYLIGPASSFEIVALTGAQAIAMGAEECK